VAVPTLLHTAGLHMDDDCADATALFEHNGDPFMDDAVPTESRHVNWNEATQDGGAWAEGSFLAEEGIRVNWVVLRSFNPKRLYNRPARQLVRRGQIAGTEMEWLEEDGVRIPIRWIRYEAGLSKTEKRLAVGYLLVYDGRPIANPYRAQLLTAPMQFVTGRLPMTIYLAFARVDPPKLDRAEEEVRDWLADSWRRYRRVCE
jgi:hypothetical protein